MSSARWDVALWDLKAKANDEPLWKTLGASSRAVKAYASGIDLSLDDDGIRKFYESQAAQGIAIGKLKVGLDREADLRRIGIMKEALATSGKDPILLIDFQLNIGRQSKPSSIFAISSATTRYSGRRSRPAVGTTPACARSRSRLMRRWRRAKTSMTPAISGP